MRLSLLSALALSGLYSGCAGLSSPASTEAPAVERQAIIGGFADTTRDFVVSVENAANTLHCSGVLISHHTVLTAGHCATSGSGGANPTHVFFGTNALSAGSPAPTSVAIATTITHSGFNGSTYVNDLALLKLAADAPAQPAPLMRDALSNTLGTYTTDATHQGPIYTLSGYGYTAAMGTTDYGTRRSVLMPINTVGPATFDDGVDNEAVDASQFLYKNATKGQCLGDSGGPTFILHDKLERVVGVHSLGTTDCIIGVDARADQAQIDTFIQAGIDTFEAGDTCRANNACDTSCTGANLDPDCDASHCGADGLCVASCALPVDPDCTGVDHCPADGYCKLGCATFDPDCAPLCVADGTCNASCASMDPDCADGGVADGGNDVGFNADLAGADLSHGDASVMPLDDGGTTTPDKGGCAFAATGQPTGLPLVLALGLLLVLRRRRAHA